jgi:LacI family transcriptional regulator
VNDDVSTGREIIDHLVSQGYRRIAHLGGPQYLNVYRNRYTGYAEGLKAHGLPVHKEWVSFDAMTQERGAAVVREWFSQQGEKPDAIYAAGDFSALGALLTLQELGIKVPEEVGVSGYANEQFTSLIQPALTSADQFSVEMGKAAADLLIKAMQGKNDGKCETRSIRPRLHIRGSTRRRGMEVTGSNGVETAEK